MNSRPDQLRAIFDAALDRDAGPEREIYVDEACRGDEALLERVKALLLAHDGAGRFLADPATADAASGVRPGPDRQAETRTSTDLGGTVGLDPPPARPEIGIRIGPYKLLQVIGEGGMGSVFMAEQERPIRRRVALKVIKAGMDTSQVVARFEAERQALALMDHANIARVLDAGSTEAGRPYFVMELVKGIPITQYCDEARLAPKERLELFIPVCRAIQHAHQKGIIHRDIKPSNVLVTLVDGRPVPKVIDFGVAKAIDQRLTERTIFTQFGAIVGTPEYMSPEQADISAQDVDTRSDVYSLGVLLYELLTGTTPLDRGTLRRAGFAEILRRVREEEPPRPSVRLSGSGDRLPGLSAMRGVEPARLARLVRADLDWIVMKSLEKDRSRRYETAAGLARDVQCYLEGDAVEACPPSARYRLGKLVRKHRAAIGIASAFALLLVAATVVSLAQAFEANRARIEADARRREAETMKDFFIDIFNKPNPAVRGSTLKVSEYLEEARVQLDADRKLSASSRDFLRGVLDVASSASGPDRLVVDLLEGAYLGLVADKLIPPLTKASLLHTLGATFRGLARDNDAKDAYRLAHDLRREWLGPMHRDTLFSRAEIVYQEDENPAESVLAGRETVAFCERTLGVDDRITIRARLNLAECLVRARIREGIELLRRNLALAEARFPPGDWTIYESRHGLAFALGWAERYPEALGHCRKAFDEKRRALGPDHPSTLMARHSLAWLLVANGKYRECEPIVRENLRIRRDKLGPGHEHTIHTQLFLARLMKETGRIEESSKIYDEALEQSEKASGKRAPGTMAVRDCIVWLKMHNGGAAEVLPFAEESFRLQREGGAGYDPRFDVDHSLALAHWWAGHRREALAMFDRFADVIEASVGLDGKRRGPDSEAAIYHRLALGELLFFEGKFDDSLAAFERIRKSTSMKFGPEGDGSTFADYIPAAINVASTRTPESVAKLRAIVDAQAARTHPGDRRSQIGQIILADAAFSVGLLSEAEAIWSSALPHLCHEVQEFASWGGMKSRLGSIYLARKEYAKAERWIVEAYRELKTREDRLPPLYKDRPAEVADRVLRLYEGWGKPEEADRWRKEIGSAGPELPADVFARP